MRKVIGMTVIAMLLVAPAFGQTAKIEYFLQLGGSSNGLGLYTPGNEYSAYPNDPSETGPEVTDTLNWAVRVQASGQHNGVDIWGVANVVWDLKLYKADNVTGIGEDQTVGADATVGNTGSSVQVPFGFSADAQTPGFFSSMDPGLAAAFARTFRVYNGAGLDDGGSPIYSTIVDPADIADGPGLSRYTYPNTMSNSQAKSGTLVGMGAGYTKFDSRPCDPDIDPGCTNGPERSGVGLTSGSCFQLGDAFSNIIAEGQLRLTGLPPGRYILKLVPGKGNNILRGDTDAACEDVILGNFAAAPAESNVVGDVVPFVIAGTIQGTLKVNITPAGIGAWSIDGGQTWNEGGASLNLDPGQYTVTFQAVEGYATPAAINTEVFADQTTTESAEYVAVPTCTPPVMVAAESVKSHGSAGTFGIPLNLAAGNATSECRINGPTQIVVTYDQNIGTAVPNVVVAGGNVVAVTPQLPAANQLTIDLNGVVDRSCVSITITGVTCEDGSAPNDAHTIKVAAVYGDVNGTRSVNVADINLLRARSSAALVTQETFMYDLNCSNRANVADINIASALSVAGTVPCTY